VGGVAERVISRDVDVLAERVAGWIGGTGRHGGNDPYVAHIARTAKVQGKTIAAFGHTHEPGRWERDGRVILNGGTWTNGRRDYALLDDSGDCTVEVFK